MSALNRTIECKRNDQCTACRGRITKGELAVFNRQDGARHPECMDMPAVRTNKHQTACVKCARVLAPGEARLELKEQCSRDGEWSRTWAASCLNGC